MKKGEKSDLDHVLQLQDLLLNNYNQDSVVLAQGQTNRTLEQSRKPTNRPTYIQSNNFWQKCPSSSIEKKSVSPTSVVGTTGVL